MLAVGHSLWHDIVHHGNSHVSCLSQSVGLWHDIVTMEALMLAVCHCLWHHIVTMETLMLAVCHSLWHDIVTIQTLMLAVCHSMWNAIVTIQTLMLAVCLKHGNYKKSLYFHQNTILDQLYGH